MSLNVPAVTDGSNFINIQKHTHLNTILALYMPFVNKNMKKNAKK